MMTSYQSLVGTCLIFILSTENQMTDAGSLREYCDDGGSFSPNCSRNRVILIDEAFYGRKHLGECVLEDLGYLGCGVDVLRLIDSKCSGRERCEISISDKNLRTSMSRAVINRCSTEVVWHLYASFTCVALTTLDDSQCNEDNRITVTDSSGYLAKSLTSMTPHVGRQPCPYRLKTQQGKRFNITVFNFLDPSSASREGNNACVRIATFRETKAPAREQQIAVCPINPRQASYFSETNEVDLFFHQSPSTTRLLRYEAFGCEDPVTVENSFVTRHGDNLAKISCNFSSTSWTVNCIDGQWEGESESCSPEGDSSSWPVNIFSSSSHFPYGILIIVAVGVALGVFLGGTLLFVASIYLKRRRLRAMGHDSTDCSTLPPFKHSDPTHFYRTDPDDRFHYPQPKLAGKDGDHSDIAAMDLIHPSQQQQQQQQQQPLQKKESTRRSSCPQKESDNSQEATLFRGASRGTAAVLPAQYGSNTRSCPHHYESPKFTQ